MATKQKANPVSKQPAKAQAKTLQADGRVITTDKATGATAVAAPPAPKVKPSLRGRSTIQGPVARVWQISDSMARAARDRAEPLPARRVVVKACVDAGIAPYTARTQYQAWFSHTGRGKNLLADGNLPKRFQEQSEEGDAE